MAQAGAPLQLLLKNPQGFGARKFLFLKHFQRVKAEIVGLYSLHSLWMRAILFAELRNVHTFIIDSLKFKRL